jgi:glycine dehydrogenase subunit 2
VPEALMIEPTETESKATLDAFADTLARIVQEDPDFLRAAPHTTPISRPDEVQAVKQPILRWQPSGASSSSPPAPAAPAAETPQVVPAAS